MNRKQHRCTTCKEAIRGHVYPWGHRCSMASANVNSTTSTGITSQSSVTANMLAGSNTGTVTSMVNRNAVFVSAATGSRSLGQATIPATVLSTVTATTTQVTQATSVLGSSLITSVGSSAGGGTVQQQTQQMASSASTPSIDHLFYMFQQQQQALQVLLHRPPQQPQAGLCQGSCSPV